MLHGGVEAVSNNGVLGDPSGANEYEGRRAMQAMADEVATAVLDSLVVPR